MPTYGRNPAKNLAPRDCISCGARFQPYRDNSFTCSRPCYTRTPEFKAKAKARGATPESRARKNAARTIANNPARRAVNMAQMLRTLYGVSIEQYKAMLTAQDGRCAICREAPDPNGVKAASRLHVDHDHDTGAVRALLCGRCNRGLGYFKDNAARLRTAAAYIDSHTRESHEGQAQGVPDGHAQR